MKLADERTINPISMKNVFFLSLAFMSSVAMEASPVTHPRPDKVSPVVTKAPNEYASMADDVLKYVNEYRRKKRLPALAMNSAMIAEAIKHSENMAARRTSFGHNGFQGRWNRISSALNGVSEIAENVAMGSTTARQVVDRWLKSPVHKENIEGNYNITGIGIAADKKGVLYFTQIFATN
ncbi:MULTISPECIES: CAP domain-containing protein [Niastella]|uniref:CAP domain-containing protein n=1 Tax=Niastella soli TaxID=2821487 RepID=A0ABS3YNC4_9BACT|nr:CAP domain-containing protein [Niastella soli]MBO9199382.1 CAP domain-containing protein [Niastella soli]